MYDSCHPLAFGEMPYERGYPAEFKLMITAGKTCLINTAIEQSNQSFKKKNERKFEDLHIIY